MTTTTQDQGYFETTVTTIDCDDNPAKIEVCVSPEEWTGVNLTVTAQHTVVSVLAGDLEHARQLRAALDEAIRYAETHDA